MTEEQGKSYQLTGQYAATAEFIHAALKGLISKYGDDDLAAKKGLGVMSEQNFRFIQSVFMRCQMQDEAKASAAASEAQPVTE